MEIVSNTQGHGKVYLLCPILVHFLRPKNRYPNALNEAHEKYFTIGNSFMVLYFTIEKNY